MLADYKRKSSMQLHPPEESLIFFPFTLAYKITLKVRNIKEMAKIRVIYFDL